MKIMKNLRIPCENDENNEKNGIQKNNNENYENHIIPYENH